MLDLPGSVISDPVFFSPRAVLCACLVMVGESFVPFWFGAWCTLHGSDFLNFVPFWFGAWCTLHGSDFLSFVAVDGRFEKVVANPIGSNTSANQKGDGGSVVFCHCKPSYIHYGHWCCSALGQSTGKSCHIRCGGICLRRPFETIRTVHVILGVVEYIFGDHLKQYEWSMSY